MKDYWERFPLTKPVLFYAAYNGILVLFSTLVASFVTFFHLLLEHKFSLIEEWIFSNAWALLILGKIFSAWMIMLFMNIRAEKDWTFRMYIRKEYQPAHPKVFLVVIFLNVFVLGICRPTLITNTNFSILGTLGSYFFNLFFYLIDYWVIGLAMDAWGTGQGGLHSNLKTTRTTFLIVMGIAFWVATRLAIPQSKTVSMLTMAHMLTILYLRTLRKGWGNVAAYLALTAAPWAALFGLDPLWRDTYVPFDLTVPMGALYVLILWPMAWVYLYRGRFKQF